MEQKKQNPYATNKAGAIGPLFKSGVERTATVIRGTCDLRAGKAAKPLKAKKQ